MSDISSVDSNFIINTKLNIDNIRFYDIKKPPFKIYGMFYDRKKTEEFLSLL